ncbi:ParB N-terminal domain-containing protein [Chryseobacterium gregarium]|uniref:hypothetical protein n=1 Tax=Chryseobacterium gregarium TaxID=456299 RepID=UPI0012DDD967|nr:hypothetical protein [Chryseobacterium gregarium]
MEKIKISKIAFILLVIFVINFTIYLLIEVFGMVYIYSSTAKRTYNQIYSEGVNYISEGNHRMAAALEYQAETRSSKYVNEFLKTGSWDNRTPKSKTYKFTVNTD